MQKTRIALFPLELLLLPGETRLLHIFEERYQQLIEECENVQMDFGIPYTVDGTITGFGSVVELVEVLQRYPNGSSDVTVRAKDMFKVDRFFLHQGDKPYPGGTIEKIDLAAWPPLSEDLLNAGTRYFLLQGRPLPPELVSASTNAMDVARVLPISDSDKLAILKAESQSRRELILRETLAFLTLLQKQKNSIEGEIFLN